MRTRVIFALAMLGACTTSEPPGDIEFTVDACAPLALVSEGATDFQRAAIEAAQELWRNRGAPALGRRAGATMEVRFDEAASAFHGLYDDQEGVIYVNRAIEIESVLAVVIAHELGHAFGMHHVIASKHASVMNPGNLSITPTAEDQRAVEALWGVCQ